MFVALFPGLPNNEQIDDGLSTEKFQSVGDQLPRNQLPRNQLPQNQLPRRSISIKSFYCSMTGTQPKFDCIWMNGQSVELTTI